MPTSCPSSVSLLPKLWTGLRTFAMLSPSFSAVEGPEAGRYVASSFPVAVDHAGWRYIAAGRLWGWMKVSGGPGGQTVEVAILDSDR